MTSDEIKSAARHGSRNLIAIACAMDNGYDDLITTAGTWDEYLELAKLIETAMSDKDEARFTLYDYIDALFNAFGEWFEPAGDESPLDKWEWGRALAGFRKDPNAATVMLIDMAQDKRRVYES